MSRLPQFLIVIGIYLLLARAALSLSQQKLRAPLFAAVNILGFICLGLLVNFDQWQEATIIDLGPSAVARHVLLIAGYVVLMIPSFYLMRSFAQAEGGLPWVAFFYPIALLVLVKYLHFPTVQLQNAFEWDDWVLTMTVVGLSYMAFRLSYLVLEVRNGTVPSPTLSEYLGFAFFLPTLVVGPINPYKVHADSIADHESATVPVGTCMLRMLVGATKYLFLANLANQLTYAGLFLDGKPHALIDLPVAAVFYYLFLYLNFSGFCDMAIGLAGLMGIRVKENFNNPFAATSVKDFWNRWHITLSEYARDVIFAPLSKYLIKTFGTRYADYCISATIVVVFLVIGIWHGVGWRFAAFGAIHAVGVAGNHLYTVWLKKRLGKEGYLAYNRSKLVNATAIVLTFGYVSASFAVFANTYDMLGLIRNALRDGLQF